MVVPDANLAYLPDPDPAQLSEHLVALANTDGGGLALGLAPTGKVLRRVSASEAEDLLRQAEAVCRPPVAAQWEERELHGRMAVVVRVPRSSELHALLDGRVLVRSGAENRALGGEEIRLLAATKSAGDYEAESCADAGWEDLDPQVIDGFLEGRQRRRRALARGEAHEVLEAMGYMRGGLPTVAGLLLFGRAPQTRFPQSGLLFVRFEAPAARGAPDEPAYGRREEIEGPLPRLIESAWQILTDEMQTRAVLRGLVREERSEYPLFAVREALVNAVCHRDYRIHGRRIELRMYPDRLEVVSPGGLPGFITLDNLVEEHYSRNPRLVAGLFQWGFVEELGLGIDRMIEEMVADGRPPPAFAATPYSFKVTLAAARERPPLPAWEQDLSERQARALNFAREHGRIANRDYRELCPEVSAETLRLDLADLVRRGLLMKVGDKKGTYYILK
jgi:ATP-dependent DNA helicase RecG